MKLAKSIIAMIFISLLIVDNIHMIQTVSVERRRVFRRKLEKKQSTQLKAQTGQKLMAMGVGLIIGLLLGAIFALIVCGVGELMKKIFPIEAQGIKDLQHNKQNGATVHPQAIRYLQRNSKIDKLVKAQNMIVKKQFGKVTKEIDLDLSGEDVGIEISKVAASHPGGFIHSIAHRAAGSGIILEEENELTNEFQATEQIYESNSNFKKDEQAALKKKITFENVENQMDSLLCKVQSKAAAAWEAVKEGPSQINKRFQTDLESAKTSIRSTQDAMKNGASAVASAVASADSSEKDDGESIALSEVTADGSEKEEDEKQVPRDEKQQVIIEQYKAEKLKATKVSEKEKFAMSNTLDIVQTQQQIIVSQGEIYSKKFQNAALYKQFGYLFRDTVQNFVKAFKQKVYAYTFWDFAWEFFKILIKVLLVLLVTFVLNLIVPGLGVLALAALAAYALAKSVYGIIKSVVACVTTDIKMKDGTPDVYGNNMICTTSGVGIGMTLVSLVKFVISHGAASRYMMRHNKMMKKSHKKLNAKNY